MLKSLDDPSSLGPGMSVALVTTFYGSLIANLFCIPVAKKLKYNSSKEILIQRNDVGRDIIYPGWREPKDY